MQNWISNFCSHVKDIRTFVGFILRRYIVKLLVQSTTFIQLVASEWIQRLAISLLNFTKKRGQLILSDIFGEYGGVLLAHIGETISKLRESLAKNEVWSKNN